MAKVLTKRKGVKLLYEYAASYIAKRLVKYKSITANRVTIFSGVLSVISAAFFALGAHLYVLLGTLFLHLCLIFDFVDGDLARLRGESSKYGKWLDTNLDWLRDFLVMFGIVWGVYSRTNQLIVWILGTIAIGTMLMMQSTLLLCVVVDENERAGVKTREVKRSVPIKIIKKIKSYLGYSSQSIWNFVTVAAIFNILYYALFFFVIIGPLNWFICLIRKGRSLKKSNTK